MKNTEARKTAKTVLGFLLVVGLLIGAFFGLDVPYDVEDVVPNETTTAETTAPPADETTAPTEDQKPADDENADVEVPVEDVVDTEDSATQDDVPQDSTPTEDNDENVDNSVDTEVTEPTEDENTVTEEGDVENA